MRKWLRFIGITVGAGVLLGLVGVGVVYWRRPQPAPVAVKPGPVSLDANSPGGSGSAAGDVTPGLSVTTNGSQGAVSGSGQSSSGGSNASGSSSGGSGSSSNGASSEADGSGLPTPSQFHTYDQFKNNASALYIDVQPGTGKAVAQGSVVTMEYRGWLTNGQEFDETYARGKPYTFTEGGGSVIGGVAEAMFGMKVGGTRRLIVPPAVGYGAAGHSPIPADAVLIFDVQLVDVQ